jgi:uncharacterized ferritin-like protein (DUF455 family)
MELRAFALKVVTTTDLESKLRSPSDLTDEEPGAPLFLTEPGRPESLRIAYGRAPKVPKVVGMADQAQRIRILHAFANHELQAVELFAWALLAYPDAPAGFRRGLLAILREEQMHTRLYMARLEAHGTQFGALPVSGYFWGKVDQLTTPARFVCALSLTFEGANLDHAREYGDAARKAGDEETARVLERIHSDEIRHVRFGAEWLQRFKDPGESLYDAYRRNVEWPLRPALAKGDRFDPEARRAAGLDDDFIERLASAQRKDR